MAISSSATGLRPGVCTSTTRPTAPYTGQIIFQTDDGQMLVWNGSSWVSLNPTANRNVIINGAFNVWQRGTSFTWSTGQPYTADRWCITPAGAAAFSASRQTSGLDQFQYCLRLQRTAANTNTSGLYVSQPVETVNSIQFQGKVVAMSFYARAGSNYSAASSLLNVRLVTGTGTDGNYLTATLTGQAIPIDTTVTLTTSWQRFIVTGTVASTANQVQPVFFYTPVGTAGASDYFEITGVQLEVGSQASAFEQRSYGTELALCQRYYYLHATGSSKAIASGHYYSAAGFEAIFPLPVRMRTTPTLDYVQGTNYYRIYSTAARDTSYIFLDSYSSDTAIAIYDNATSSGTAGYGGIWYTFNAASYVGFKAEL